MIPGLRRDFNQRFTLERYAKFLQDVQQRCGVSVRFRLCETPIFIPADLLEKMQRYGQALITQLVGNLEYQHASDAAIPPDFHAPNESVHPMFIQVDFGLVRNPDGSLAPKLVELQGFPSLYAFQSVLSQVYIDSYGLPADLQIFSSGLDHSSYLQLLRRCILNDHPPENVVLLEIDPLQQKTLPDFLMTEELCGIETVNLRDVIKHGTRLYHSRNGKEIPIARIYNRAIVDELVRKDVTLPFDYRDDLTVEWAGHPNWYFRMSKFSIPYLKHECVPETHFLGELDQLPDDRENYLLKPLYSFAGSGILFNPTDVDIAAIPPERRHEYILQRRMNFAPVIETPHGATQAEIRIMYLWPEQGELTPALTLIRMGRGKMMGVDHNRNMEWVGASAGLHTNDYLPNV
jgi:hypothetical protein